MFRVSVRGSFWGVPLWLRAMLLCLTLLFLADALAHPLLGQALPGVDILHNFSNNGATPMCSLVQDGDDNFYGTASQGGLNNLGVVFKVDPDGALTTLLDFDGYNGAVPLAGLILASDGYLYGATSQGGADYQPPSSLGGYNIGKGTVFRISLDGDFAQLASFGSLPEGGPNSPQAPLLQAADGNFYGTTTRGGGLDLGTVFKITPDGTVNVLFNFDGTNGAQPVAALIQTPDGFFYGTTQGTSTFNGTAFRMTAAGALTTLANFSPQNDPTTGGRTKAASGPMAPLLLASDGALYGTTFNGGAGGYGTIFRVTPNGTLSMLYNFEAVYTLHDAVNPQGGLVIGPDGALYGTTRDSLNSLGGAIYRITLGGQYSVLFEPTRTTGPYYRNGPAASLLLGSDGNFYGTTVALGTNGLGEIFQMTPAGDFNVLASFYYPIGSNPTALTAAPDGSLYGVTTYGGLYNGGVAFRLDFDGYVTPLAYFDPSTNVGLYPVNPLTLGGDGNFYGTTTYSHDGFYLAGSLFRLTPDGVLSAVTALPRNDYGALTLGLDNNLYVLSSGVYDNISRFYRFNADGSLTTLRTFSSYLFRNGAENLTRDFFGNFYGCTQYGANGKGAIFKLTPAGDLTTVVDFNGANGSGPSGAITVGADGNLYGTTYSSNDLIGTIYRLTLFGTLTTVAQGYFTAAGINGPSLVTSSDGSIYGYEFYSHFFRLGEDGSLNSVANIPLTYQSEGGPTPDFTFTAGPDGAIYGVTNAGGNSGAGTIFKYDPAGTGPTPTPTPTPIPTPTPLPPGTTPPPTPTPTPTPPPGPTPTPAPPPSSGLTLYGANRSAGGDKGPFTVTLYGSGFQPGAVVRLTAAGQPDIVATAATPSADGFSLAATLPLAGRTNGVYYFTVTNPDGASRTLPTGFTVQPARFTLSTASGGDTSAVTVTLSGNSGFQPGASIQFVAAGKPAIPGGSVFIGADGFGLTATFDLRGKANGAYSVVVTNPDGSGVTLPGAFQVVPGGKPVLTADIIGRDALRAGRAQAYTFVVRNSGNVDAAAVPLFITFPDYFKYSLVTPLINLPQPDGLDAPVDYSQIPLAYPNGDRTLLPLIVPKAPAGGERTVVVNFTVPDLPQYAHIPFDVSVSVGEPLLDASTGRATAAVQNAFGLLAKDYGPITHDDDEDTQLLNNCLSGFFGILVDCLSVFYPPVAAAKCGPSAVLAVEQILSGTVLGNNTGVQATVSYAQAGATAALAVLNCTGRLVPVYGQIISAIQCGMDLVITYENCVEPAIHKLGETITSNDPNDIVGSEGDGSAAHYLAGQSPLRYAVYFANKEDASAPAQRVVITDQLDRARMDLSTFRLGPIGFGSTTLTPPNGVASYSTTVDLRPANNLLVRVDAALDANTGLLTYTFQSLDPATGQPPEDPRAGFLPPDRNPPAGEGFAFFSVLPKAGQKTNEAIRSLANIIFDTNPAIATSTWINTIDNDKPSSQITPLPKKVKTAQIAMQLNPSDNGAGVNHYNLYVSEDGGAFQLAARNTAGGTITYNGVTGHSYAFFTQAVDGAGNVEPLKSAAEAATKIKGVDLIGAWKKGVTTQTAANGRIKISGNFKVTNQSPQKAMTGEGVVRLYLSTDATLDANDAVIGKDLPFSALTPNASAKIPFEKAKLPREVASASGMFVLAVIDPDGAVPETDKSNNVVAYGPLP